MKIKIDDYEVIESGTFLLSHKNSVITMDIEIHENLVGILKIKFDVDEKETEGRIEAKTEEHLLELTLFNFKDIGTGTVEPIVIGIYENKDIRLHIWSSFLNGVRKVEYTILWG